MDSAIAEMVDLQDVLIEVQVAKSHLRDARRAYERAEQQLVDREGQEAARLRSSVRRRLKAVSELEPA